MRREDGCSLFSHGSLEARDRPIRPPAKTHTLCLVHHKTRAWDRRFKLSGGTKRSLQNIYAWLLSSSSVVPSQCLSLSLSLPFSFSIVFLFWILCALPFLPAETFFFKEAAWTSVSLSLSFCLRSRGRKMKSIFNVYRLRCSETILNKLIFYEPPLCVSQLCEVRWNAVSVSL